MAVEKEGKSYPTETLILMSLKEKDGQSLDDLSHIIGISKMAVLKHLQSLEGRKIVERRIVKKSIGRPYYRFYLLAEAASALGSTTDKMFDSLLSYINESGNRELIVNFLKKRYKDVEKYYKNELSNKSGEERIEALAKLLFLENCFPELRKIQGQKYEMLEFNCPIYTVSKKFGEACELERNLFQNVLNMKVNTTHLLIDGHGTCRFLIENNSKKSVLPK